MVGATLVVGIAGPTVTAEEAAHLRAIHAGGFISFERNFQSPEQFIRLMADLKAALGRELLVMVDHEGGRIIRFSSGVTRFPDPLSLGRTAAPEQVQRQGEIEANELKALGVHLNLAPCVDVLIAGSDPVISSRSYGADPRRVAELVCARIRGMQQHGVAACAKHFPGLGAVPKDPHIHLPTLQLNWATMQATHLVPFVEAIRAGVAPPPTHRPEASLATGEAAAAQPWVGGGVATIMSSHVCYPRLDPTGVPATFSPRLIRTLLREELGFQGLILTDDLEMGALHALCPIGEAAVRAVEAGHDLLLICHRPEAQREAFDALCAAYRSSRLAAAMLERTVERVRTFKQDYLAACSC